MLKYFLYVILASIIVVASMITHQAWWIYVLTYFTSCILFELCLIAEKLNRLFQKPGTRTYHQMGHLMPDQDSK